MTPWPEAMLEQTASSPTIVAMNADRTLTFQVSYYYRNGAFLNEDYVKQYAPNGRAFSILTGRAGGLRKRCLCLAGLMSYS